MNIICFAMMVNVILSMSILSRARQIKRLTYVSDDGDGDSVDAGDDNDHDDDDDDDNSDDDSQSNV